MKIETYWNAYLLADRKFFFAIITKKDTGELMRLDHILTKLSRRLTTAIRRLDTLDAQAGKRTQFDGGGDV